VTVGIHPTWTYTYDDAGRLKTLSQGTKTFTFSYDAASRRTGLSAPKTSSSYTYDANSRLTGLTTLGKNAQGATVTLFSATYTHDAVGNVLTKAVPEHAETYTYDELYRLTQVQRGTSVSEAYTYDAVGNRLSSLGGGAWTYGDRNELLATPFASYSYDANGNLETRTEGGTVWTYEWDAENRLKRVLSGATEKRRAAGRTQGVGSRLAPPQLVVGEARSQGRAARCHHQPRAATLSLCRG
jgi:YD repeat-containing protein